jgi:hypothetical protein
MLYIITILKNIKTSLILLKEYALNAAFKVPILLDQKLIKKNEVIPIISHPKNKTIKLPELTNNIILKINKFKKSKSLSTNGSYLKYENVNI